MVKPKKGVNYYLAMASKDGTWLRYKMEELHDLFPKALPNMDGNTYRCTSRCCNELSTIRHEIYKDEVRDVSLETLDGLRDIALAIWFCDGGGKTGRGHSNAYLNLTKMARSVDIIKRYFCGVDMDCKVNSSKSRIRLVFSIDGTHNLFKTIAHRFPSFMCHKL